ncbi:MAG: hypothetical protein K5851_09120 [Lachnospiraceae bacterium]|nr:hypothetical protein [Lachnospiraceae bacterium]
MALRFRDDSKVVRIKKKAITFGAIFVGALLFFSVALNYHGKSGKKVKQEASLPILYAKENSTCFNEMHGYIDSIDVGVSNSNLIPVSNGKVSLELDTYGNSISGVEYELCNQSGKKVISTGKASLSKKDGKVDFTINLGKKMSEGENYLLKFKVSIDSKEVVYYSRVCEGDMKKFNECLNFANDIRNAIIAKDETKLSCMEPVSDAYSDSLAKVNIHSSMKQITWDSIQIKSVSDPVININTFYNNTAEITYRYTVNDDENSYAVREYMKVKSADTQYLIDYERDAEEIFVGTRSKQLSNGLSLGMVSSDIPYASNKTGRIVAFANNGRLFEYNQTTGKMVKIFDFGDGKADKRTDYWQHGIRILNIGEGGSLDFAVYGYMNSGTHEGRSGISFFKYDSSTDETTEQVFTRSDMQFEFLKNEYSDTMYRSRDGSYNIVSDGSLYVISASGKEIDTKLSGLTESQYKESSNGRFISWTDKDEPSDVIHTIDLENGKQFEFKADKGEKVIPLLFIGSDFVFGKVYDNQVGVDETGNNVYPMHEIVIADVSRDRMKIEKQYPQTDSVVTEVTQNDSTLYLKKCTLQNGVYVSTSEDVIKNTFVADNGAVSITNHLDSKKGTVYNLSMVKNMDIPKKKIAVSNISMRENNEDVKLPTPDFKETMYVVKGAHILGEGDKIHKLIQMASENNASVMNSEEVIWSCVKRDSVHALKVNESDFKALKNETNKKKLLKLNGVELSNILYYVSSNCPVYAVTDSGEYLVIGYDSIGITLYNPATGEYETTMQSAFAGQTSAKGNLFKTYLK